MDPMIIIMGGGGVAHEVAWLLSEEQPSRTPSAFVVSDSEWIAEKTIDGIHLIPDREFAVFQKTLIHAYLAVGSPVSRQALHARLKLRPSSVKFPSLIHAAARMDSRPGKVHIGEGVIIYPFASISTNVSLGNFVQINPCSTIGHGTKIGDYTTICPGANISGNVTIGSCCFIGAGAVVRDKITIIDNCVIGAGATVVKSISEPGTYIGTPAHLQS
jgi:sugar O-acyltransferase (sialic acid O-acetyltransferase NeuD family)